MINREAIEYLMDVRNGIHIPSPGRELPLLNEQEKKAIDLAISALEKQEADRWIPVTERLPEDGERVLITYWKNVIQATWDEMRGCFFNTNAVLLDIELIHAWRPLPEAYTEEEA